jgi:hypothetical protein
MSIGMLSLQNITYLVNYLLHVPFAYTCTTTVPRVYYNYFKDWQFHCCFRMAIRKLTMLSLPRSQIAAISMLCSAPVRLYYMFSFRGVIDLVCCVPIALYWR